MSHRTGEKIPELESLRGLAALLVVFYHVPSWHSLRDVNFIDNSFLMVDLFFVLSGFVIFNAYHDRISSLRQLLRFQFLRLGRLYPVHLLFLIVFLLIEAGKYFAQHSFGLVSPNSEPFVRNDGVALVQHFFLLQAIWPGADADTFNAPAWSISVEFYTCLIFAVTSLVFGKARVVAFGILAMGALGSLFVQSDFETAYLLRGLTGFFIGCLTAFGVDRWSCAMPKWGSSLAAAALAGLLIIRSDADFDTLIYPLSAGVIAMLVMNRDGWLNRILVNRLLVWLGEISYSVYMSHLAIIWAVNQFIRVVLQRPEHIEGDGISVPQLDTGEMLLAWMIVLALVVAVSAMVHVCIERPLRARSRAVVGAYSRERVSVTSALRQ